MSADYLEEAAAVLRKAREDLEAGPARNAAHEAACGREATAAQIMRGVHGRRMEIAAAFTRLAAIERGLLPPDMESPQDGAR
jgi:hypothetical protein